MLDMAVVEIGREVVVAERNEHGLIIVTVFLGAQFSQITIDGSLKAKSFDRHDSNLSGCVYR